MRVFYQLYRPQKFSDLIGQETIAKTLLSQLETGKFSHGYLFYGPKGTGKTSTARILAKAVNCEVYGKKESVNRQSLASLRSRSRLTVDKLGEPCNKCVACTSITDGSNLDLIEIDAASNRGIDEIRDLREKIKLSPISARFKVYIIDEAHMLTAEAFNALLKTLEEPPKHAIFILCTTEVGKLPQTIVSRLQKFNFQRAKKEDLVKIIEKIAKSEKVNVEKEAANEIANAADGSWRDAVSIFDQLSSSKKSVKVEDVVKVVRIGGWNQLYEFVQLMAHKNVKDCVLLIEEMVQNGADIAYFARQIVLFLEKLLFIKIGILGTLDKDLGVDQKDMMKMLANEFEKVKLEELMKQFLVAESEMKLYPLPQIPLVLVISKQMDEEVGYRVEEEVDGKLETRDKQSLHSSQAAGPKQEETRNTDNEADEKVDEVKVQNDLKGEEPKIEPSKADKKSAKSLKHIEKNWDKFLNKVKPVNAQVVALLRSTRPLEVDGVNLRIEVFYRFHKEKLEEPKIITMLDKIISEVINSDIKLRFVLAAKGDKPPSVVTRSNVVDITSEDLAQVAQEIFSK